MRFRSLIARLLLALAFVGVAVVQGSGARGYLCLCGPTPIPTQAAFCGESPGEDCHGDDAAGGAHSNSRGAHEKVGQEAQIRPVPVATMVGAPLPVVLVLPPNAAPWAGGGQWDGLGHAAVESGKSPPPGVSVARTIVLLI